jgi:ABC-type phosphate/phosphonate transport system substrate-binding protein
MLLKLRSRSRRAIFVVALTMLAGPAAGEDSALVLLVQPLPREEMPAETLQPLADYIAALSGRSCRIDRPPNFPAYWEAVRRRHYDLAFDAPYFADYRVQKFGFDVLVKTPETASYSLIVRADARTRDPASLVGKRVATLGLISIGTLRLNALFPNPIRQPVLVDVAGSEDGLGLLLEKKVEAAFLPTARVGKQVRSRGVAVVLTTEPIARLALSASPNLPRELTTKIRAGLLRAHTADAGRAMLRAIGIDYFDGATNEEFANQSYVLKGYWGY